MLLFFIAFSSLWAKVFIDVQRKGQLLEVWIVNSEIFDVTTDLSLKSAFLETSTPTPLTTVVKHQTKKRVMTLQITDKRFSYTTHIKWTLGSHLAKHDDTYLYALPFASGRSYRVSQGFYGTKTHDEKNQYAVDFEMPEGTWIYAARDGMVVQTKSDSNKGGADKRFLKDANYIKILHRDGTFGLYYHLRKNGVKVKVGDHVERGSFLGLSGKTGYAKGPHLHFSVYKVLDTSNRISVPFRCRTAQGVVEEIRTNVYYKAP
jgi:murein DD-endopeptidase MepM/ murein hydrolase activator NlpD